MNRRACLIPGCPKSPRRPDYALCHQHTDDALRNLAGGPLIRAVASVERVSLRLAELARPGR